MAAGDHDRHLMRGQNPSPQLKPCRGYCSVALLVPGGQCRCEAQQQCLARGAEIGVVATTLAPGRDDEQDEASENEGGEDSELEHGSVEEPERHARVRLIFIGVREHEGEADRVEEPKSVEPKRFR